MQPEDNHALAAMQYEARAGNYIGTSVCARTDSLTTAAAEDASLVVHSGNNNVITATCTISSF